MEKRIFFKTISFLSLFFILMCLCFTASAVDPEGTVVSLDGKSRITDFDMNWVTEPSNTIMDKEILQLQVNWAISGERFYEPGTLKITLPHTAIFESITEGRIGYPILLGSLPTPAAKLNADGSVDFTANYGTSDFAHYIDAENNTITIINISPLDPGNSGTFTINYNNDHNDLVGNLRYVYDGSLATVESYISIYISNEETITRDTAPLYIKLDSNNNFYIYKRGLLYKEWKDNWGDIVKPVNHGDYWYIFYKVSVSVNDTKQIYNILINEQIGANQTLIGYLEANENYNYNASFTENDFNYSKPFVPLTDTVILNKDVPLYEGESASDKKTNYTYHNFFVLSRVPYKDLGLDDLTKNQSKTFVNSVNVTVTPLNSDDLPVTKNNSTSVLYEYIAPVIEAVFTAPGPDTYTLHKGIYVKNETIYPQLSEEITILEDENLEPEIPVKWRIVSNVTGSYLTRDETLGDENTKESYGVKNYTVVTTDDYVYLNNDYSRELTSEDYEVRSVIPALDAFDYKLNSNKASYGYFRTYKLIPTKIYARKSSTGEWEPMVSFNYPTNTNYPFLSQFDKPFMSSIVYHNPGVKLSFTNRYYFWSSSSSAPSFSLPAGYNGVKMEAETNASRLLSYLDVDGYLKSSNYVNNVLNSTSNESFIFNSTMRNDGTFSVYNSDGELKAYLNNETRNETNSRTFDLDLENYGQEMHHVYAYYNFYCKEITPTSFIDKVEKDFGHFNAPDATYNYSSFGTIRNDIINQRFVVPTRISLRTQLDKGPIDAFYKRITPHENGTFYDLLPLGVTGISKPVVTSSQAKRFYNVNYHWNYNQNSFVYTDKSTGSSTLNSSYRFEHNWRDTGRTMLIIEFDNAELSKNMISGQYNTSKPIAEIQINYNTYYPWDSYKDYGGELHNFVAFEGANGTIYSGNPDNGVFPDKHNHRYIYNYTSSSTNLRTNLLDEKNRTVAEMSYKNLNPENDNPNFLYAWAKTDLFGNTISNTGLTKQVKDSRDSGYSLKTSTLEGGSYSYKIRMQALSGTDIEDLIFFDSLENYDPLIENEDYGADRWWGVFDSIDLNNVIMRGIKPVVYYSTIPNLTISENRDLTNTSIWSVEMPLNKSDVTAIAVDLTTKTDGTPFVLREQESVNIIIHMKSPSYENSNPELIKTGAKALNEIYANVTVSSLLSNAIEKKLINIAYTAVDFEPIKTEAEIIAKKEFKDKNNNPIALVGGEFTFELKDSNGNVLQKKTNAADGSVTFDPIVYRLKDPGLYKYTVEEIGGGVGNIVYDYTVYNVSVNVVKSGNSISSTVNYVDGNPLFKNKEIDVISKTVTKNWAGLPEGAKGSNVSVQLKQNGINYGEAVILTDDGTNLASYTWTGLPKYALDSSEYIYTVDEEFVPLGYIKSVSEDGWTITNTYDGGEVISKTVIKNWAGLPAGEIGSNASVQLKQNGVNYGEAVILTDDGTNYVSYTWTDLPRYALDSSEYIYTADEEFVPVGYTKSVSEDGFTITNTYDGGEVISKTVTKNWGGLLEGEIGSNVSVQLKQNGINYGEAVILTDDGTNFASYTWTGLPRYALDSSEYIYTTDEVFVPLGYVKSISEDGFTITNTYNGGGVVNKTVTKNWAGLPAGEIGSNVSVQLKQNGINYGEAVILTDDGTNFASYTWTGLPKYALDSSEYVYTADEEFVPVGYTKSVSEDGFTITNTYDGGGVINKTVTKNWAGLPAGEIGSNVSVQLKQNGVNYRDPVILTDDGTNSVSHTWYGLPKYATDGSEIVYSVDEPEVPEDYVKTIDGSIITNTYSPVIVPPNPKVEKIDVTGYKVWKTGPKPRPDIWLKLYRNVLGEKPKPVNVDIIKLSDGETKATWYNLDNINSEGLEYIYSVKEVDEFGNDFVPEGYKKYENGKAVSNFYIDSENIIEEKPIKVIYIFCDEIIGIKEYNRGDKLSFEGIPIQYIRGFYPGGWVSNEKPVDENTIVYNDMTVEQVWIPLPTVNGGPLNSSIKDVIMLLQYTSGIGPLRDVPKSNMIKMGFDLNRDGNIDIVDVIIYLKYV